MKGLLLKLLDDTTGRPGRFFWKLFEPIRHDLDRLFWCSVLQPWMGYPPGFEEDDTAWMPFEGEGDTETQLWRPGTLSRYAEHFGEEHIELWGIEPTRDNPQELAALYNATPWRKQDKIIEQYARVWLLYTDSTCWEIYTRKPELLQSLRDALCNKPWLEIHGSQHDQRGVAFKAAGLSGVWAALNGRHS